jgi:hypothetical protein
MTMAQLSMLDRAFEDLIPTDARQQQTIESQLIAAASWLN